MAGMGTDGDLILVVDDDHAIVNLITYILKQQGYRVKKAYNGREALLAAGEELPDLIVVDLMMPEMDGSELCRKVRQNVHLQETPILVLTALSESSNEIDSLDAGADDYVTKPIAPELFLSHVRALLRRSQRGEPGDGILEVHDLIIDRDRHIVVQQHEEGPKEFQLPKKEFDLLSFMAAHPGRVFSRQELLDRVWGADVYVIDRTIDVHIRKIREKLGDAYIVTVRGRGYKFRT